MNIPQSKISVGILGATGMVGQRYISLLEHHPWFKVTYVAASSRSAGMTYEEAVAGRWHMDTPLPESIGQLTVHDASDVSAASSACRFVFSALEMDTKDEVKALEKMYASSDMPVVSNASAQRGVIDVPMLIPEVNPHHLDIIPFQKKHYGWERGLIVTKPNCSLQSYVTPLWALLHAGYPIEKIMVTTLQALSGAGYPGVPSVDMIDNILPFIKGEEEKTEEEPLKIFGTIENEEIVPYRGLKISATCTRVPVIDGHTAVVSILFANKKPAIDEIKSIWREFRGVPQERLLPSAPLQPLLYREEENRPQPRRDRGNESGMGVTIGRLRECPLLDYKFVALSHNTIRGAAGGGILNAELLVSEGYIL